jgi:hypothetical protein
MGPHDHPFGLPELSLVDGQGDAPVCDLERRFRFQIRDAQWLAQ